MESRFHDVGAVRLHAVEAGTGPLVLLLHGFPDFWYSWRRQIPALAAAGYRAVAPDLRGYNLSDKPRPVSAYGMEHLVGDVAALVGACGARSAHVVGHDWGGAVAWALAAQRPELVERLAVLNAPHPGEFARALARNPGQVARSAYMLSFQVPWLPEALLRARDFRALRRGLASAAVHPEAFTPADLDRYAEAFARPGALRAGLNYYRAAARGLRPMRLAPSATGEPAGERAVVPAPTLVIWGDRDRFLGPELSDPGDRAPDARVEHLPGAGHWVHLDDPARVNALLLEFLAGATAGQARRSRSPRT